MSRSVFVALTGGPGGGKSTLVEELRCDPAWSGRVVFLPEAISVAGRVGLSPREQTFQRVMVTLQMALEDGLERGLVRDRPRVVLCHRGSLDPLAYWLDRGWPPAQFYAVTGTVLEEHYRRYAAVLHLVTAADGARQHYLRWPHAHRRETAEEARRLDGLLGHVWGAHPHYHWVGNEGRDWAAKSEAARRILQRVMPAGGRVAVPDRGEPGRG